MGPLAYLEASIIMTKPRRGTKVLMSRRGQNLRKTRMALPPCRSPAAPRSRSPVPGLTLIFTSRNPANSVLACATEYAFVPGLSR